MASSKLNAKSGGFCSGTVDLLECAGLALFLCCLSTIALAQESVGYVLELQGTWATTDGPGKLGRGDSIPGGVLIRNSSTTPSDGDRIVVADLKGDIIKRIRCKSGICTECRDSGVCYDPIQPLPDAGPQTSILAAAFHGLMTLFASQPDRYSVHRVRGISIPDGIAQISNDYLDISSIFKTAPKGSYFFTLRQIPREGSSNIGGSDRQALEWDPIHSEQISIKGVHIGLYEGALEWSGGATSFWVLITTPQRYPDCETAFRQLASKVEAWGPDVSGDSRLAYERAYLAYLASQP